MTEEKLTCYYCNLEKPNNTISYFKDKDGETRNVCIDCRVKGKYWKDLKD